MLGEAEEDGKTNNLNNTELFGKWWNIYTVQFSC